MKAPMTVAHCGECNHPLYGDNGAGGACCVNKHCPQKLKSFLIRSCVPDVYPVPEKETA